MAGARPLRWLNVGLRGLHLAAVILLAATLLGAPPPAGLPGGFAPLAVLATGVVIFGLDLWVYPGHLFEASGASVVIKLALVAWMAIDAAARLPLFWVVVFWSTLFSHAPASLRHVRLRRR